MREATAILRATWLSAASYRVNMMLSLGAVVASVVPVYFIAGALQPLIGAQIQTHGDQYFAFVIVGLAAQSLITAALYALPQALGSAITTGTLEALLSTPGRWRSIFLGLSLYSFAWTGVKVMLTLLLGVALGMHVVWGRGLAAVAILGLIVLAHAPISVLSAAMVMAFRTPGPLPQIVLTLSALLGGVYYPTHIIPAWMHDVSRALPLTYGLRALRRVMLEGWTFGAVASDVAVVAGFAVVLGALGLSAFGAALRYARRVGTLAQY